MEKKNVPIDIAAHSYAKQKAAQLGIGLAAYFELSAIEYGKTLPEPEPIEGINDRILLSPPIIQKPVGRPSGKVKAISRCEFEYSIFTAGRSEIDKMFDDIKPKKPSLINLTFEQSGKDYMPYGLESGLSSDKIQTLAFCHLIDNDTTGYIDGQSYELLMSINGMDNTVELTEGIGEYYPANELASKLLSFYPNRQSFDKVSLIFFDNTLGLSINIITAYD